MKIKPLFFCLLLIFAFLTFLNSIIFADDPIVAVGESCSEEGQTYHLTSSISKTPWQLNELYAVPPGTLSPELWDASSSFNIQFNAELDSADSIGFAQAAVTIWQNFFSENADVIFTVNRTITGSDEILQCISGTWNSISTQSLEVHDTSDWLITANSPYDVENPASQSILQSDLQSTLDNLNNQPGADSEP